MSEVILAVILSGIKFGSLKMQGADFRQAVEESIMGGTHSRGMMLIVMESDLEVIFWLLVGFVFVTEFVLEVMFW